MPRPQPSLIPVATIGAIALALAVSGCGRKGALDPPPGGYQIERGIGRTPVSSRGTERPVERQQPEYDQEGRPIAPSGTRKKLPGDWLIE